MFRNLVYCTSIWDTLHSYVLINPPQQQSRVGTFMEMLWGLSTGTMNMKYRGQVGVLQLNISHLIDTAAPAGQTR